jgi:non-ribosomal peptide synthetase component F
LLVLRTDISGYPSFQELLQQVRKVTLEAYTHQDLPFDKLVEELQPERHFSNTPLFQVLFVMDNVPRYNLQLPGLRLLPMMLKAKIVKFNLALFISQITWDYRVFGITNLTYLNQNKSLIYLRSLTHYLQVLYLNPMPELTLETC